MHNIEKMAARLKDDQLAPIGLLSARHDAERALSLKTATKSPTLSS